jgi:hypothetical protein
MQRTRRHARYELSATISRRYFLGPELARQKTRWRAVLILFLLACDDTTILPRAFGELVLSLG